MASQAGRLAKKLITWYRQKHRDLPWRNTNDPYAIWVSEIMLQQTQVATVLPYYRRFMDRYPDIAALAEAPLGEVLKVWEGLGYYARARNLHKAAQRVVTDYHGIFPSAYEEIHALPGIGQSTAGAIATFAFKKPHAILDGNVKRVLSRLYAVNKPVQSVEAATLLWEKSRLLLPGNPDEAYDFNQALMEIGATLCTPKQPICGQCPWQNDCRAYKENRQSEIPLKQAPRRLPHYTIAVGVIHKEDRILIALRPENGLLGGLWEFPGGKCRESEMLKDCVKREILEETGLNITVDAQIAVVRHAYTHFKITLHAFDCQYLSGEAKPRASDALKWVTLDEIDRYAFPKANKKVLEVLRLPYIEEYSVHRAEGRSLPLQLPP
jgi:A/G-specific adenine glycosylase